MEIKPDLEATSFSEQNAYFLAEMCLLAYEDKDQVRSALESQGFWGAGVSAGDNFQWFEVCIYTHAYT